MKEKKQETWQIYAKKVACNQASELARKVSRNQVRKTARKVAKNWQ